MGMDKSPASDTHPPENSPKRGKGEAWSEIQNNFRPFSDHLTPGCKSETPSGVGGAWWHRHD
jgi:hypothetical protein